MQAAPESIRANSARANMVYGHQYSITLTRDQWCVLSSQKSNGLVIEYGRQWWLSENSLDHYGIDISLLVPPFRVEIVEAGPRMRWRWTNDGQPPEALRNKLVWSRA